MKNKNHLRLAAAIAAVLVVAVSCGVEKKAQYGNSELTFDGVTITGTPDDMEKAFIQRGYEYFGMGSSDLVGKYGRQKIVLHIERTFGTTQTEPAVIVRRELSPDEPGLSWEIRQLQMRLNKDYGQPVKESGPDGCDIYTYPSPEGQSVVLTVFPEKKDCGDWILKVSGENVD